MGLKEIMGKATTPEEQISVMREMEQYQEDLIQYMAQKATNCKTEVAKMLVIKKMHDELETLHNLSTLVELAERVIAVRKNTQGVF